MKSLLTYFSFIMVAVYISIGCVFLFTSVLETTFANNRKLVGVVFIVYAGFRIVTILMKRKKENHE